jgi:glucokinase
MEYYFGLDIGGTTIKGVCCNAQGQVLSQDSVPTNCENGGMAMCDSAIELCMILKRKAPVGKLVAVGIGCPGMIDSQSGEVVFAGNLGLKNFPLGDEIAKRLKVPVKVTNDANAAALGEAKFGAGKSYSDSILVTLGTGVGGGIIIGGKLFEGNKSAGAEIGHMVIERYGHHCTCGRRGCFETYSSATALIKKTKEVMEEDMSSEMWHTYTSETATGKTAFDYMDTDTAAKEVVDWYVRYLACGLINLANIFRPQVIMLGGGVAAQGERLTVPVQKILDKEVFGGNDRARVEVVCATLGNLAGALGAAALVI